jgi:hypothetical protein
VNALAARVFARPRAPIRHTGSASTPSNASSRPAAEASPPCGRRELRRGACGPDLKVAEARELEARVLAGVVERLRGEDGVRYGDMAVLFRAFTEVKTYENALRRREIPYYVVKGRGFFQCQEVSDMASMLAAVLDRDDGVALAAALRSPLFALDDDTLWRLAWPEGATAGARAALPRARGVRRPARRGGAPRPHPRPLAAAPRAREPRDDRRAAGGGLRRHDFEAVCLTQFQGTQKVANVRKLIELARAWERKRFFSLRDFVRTVRRMAETEPREPEAPLVGEQDDVVRLMTIHQAKGLEFGAVLVPDSGGRSTRTTGSPRSTRSSASSAGRSTPRPGRRRARGARGRTRARRDRERAEQARLFYVACTRAKDILVLLEGKGDARHLTSGEGDRASWCHQVWDVVGRERVLEFVASRADERTVVLPDGVLVRLERAARHLAPVGGEPPAPVARVAPAGTRERTQVARVLAFAPPPPARSSPRRRRSPTSAAVRASTGTARSSGFRSRGPAACAPRCSGRRHTASSRRSRSRPPTTRPCGDSSRPGPRRRGCTARRSRS